MIAKQVEGNMVGSGFLSPIDTARAKLQEQVGYFLSSRAKLIRLMSNPQLGIQGQARGLYVVQTQLEDRLQNEITPKLQVISTGVWDSSNLLELGWFTIQLMNQIKAVDSLERQAGGPSMDRGMDLTTIGMIAAGGLILLGLGLMGGGYMSGRKQIL